MPSTILDTLPDAQVFERDPESFSTDDIPVLVARFQKILTRIRKARQDDSEIAAASAKLKKANAAAKKKASKKLAADPMETIV